MKHNMFSQEQIVRILHEAELVEPNIAGVCLKHGVSEPSLYRWKNKYGGMDVRDTMELKELEGKKSRLKRLLA